MLKILEGRMKSKGKKFAVVVSRFNEFVTRRLLDGCLKEFRRLGVGEKDIEIVWVPGSFEIPLVALKLARKKSVNAVICLGAVIEGETLHFDVISRTVTQGISQAAFEAQKPVIFGVLTTYTVKQAYQRSAPKGDNKGRDAARAAVLMAELYGRI